MNNHKVVLVEPDFTRTSLDVHGKAAHEVIDAYAEQREQVFEAIQGQISNGTNPHLVAEAIYHALRAESPRPRYRVGRTTNLVVALKSLLPKEAFHRAVNRVFQMN